MIVPPDQEPDVMAGLGKPPAVITPYGAGAYHSYTLSFLHVIFHNCAGICLIITNL
jgi:hypothetical protein